MPAETSSIKFDRENSTDQISWGEEKSVFKSADRDIEKDQLDIIPMVGETKKYTNEEIANGTSFENLKILPQEPPNPHPTINVNYSLDKGVTLREAWLINICSEINELAS